MFLVFTLPGAFSYPRIALLCVAGGMVLCFLFFNAQTNLRDGAALRLTGGLFLVAGLPTIISAIFGINAEGAPERMERRRKHHLARIILPMIEGRIIQLEEEEALRDERKQRRDDSRSKGKFDDHMLTLRSALRALKEDPSNGMMITTMDKTLSELIADEDTYVPYLLTVETQQDLKVIAEQLQMAGVDDPFLMERLNSVRV